MIPVEVVLLFSFFGIAPFLWGFLIWRVAWFREFHRAVLPVLKLVVVLEWGGFAIAMALLFQQLGWTTGWDG